jgi:pSer/pThr/pTyr-binding forkhead associated (FHA) protein
MGHKFEEHNSQWARAFWPPERARVSDWLIEFQGRRYWLPKRLVTIGSAPRSHIRVEDDINIYGEHAELLIVGDRVQLLDVGWSSVTLVDGQPIKKFNLRGGEVVAVGSFVFSVLKADDLG